MGLRELRYACKDICVLPVCYAGGADGRYKWVGGEDYSTSNMTIKYQLQVFDVIIRCCLDIAINRNFTVILSFIILTNQHAAM